MMLKLAIFAVAALLIAFPLSAQDQSHDSASTSTSASQSQQDQHADQSQHDNSKKNRSKKKQDKDKDRVEDVSGAADFSDAVAYAVIQRLADGLEAHNERLMLSAFDENKLEGYLNFEHQILALFQRYDSFRVHFRISEDSTEGSKGAVLVDIEMEEIPRSENGQPVRKREQIRFEMERGKKGWKIVDLKPRTFFS
jgi:hypothetical protein